MHSLNNLPQKACWSSAVEYNFILSIGCLSTPVQITNCSQSVFDHCDIAIQGQQSWSQIRMIVRLSPKSEMCSNQSHIDYTGHSHFFIGKCSDCRFILSIISSQHKNFLGPPARVCNQVDAQPFFVSDNFRPPKVIQMFSEVFVEGEAFVWRAPEAAICSIFGIVQMYYIIWYNSQTLLYVSYHSIVHNVCTDCEYILHFMHIVDKTFEFTGIDKHNVIIYFYNHIIITGCLCIVLIKLQHFPLPLLCCVWWLVQKCKVILFDFVLDKFRIFLSCTFIGSKIPQMYLINNSIVVKFNPVFLLESQPVSSPSKNSPDHFDICLDGFALSHLYSGLYRDTFASFDRLYRGWLTSFNIVSPPGEFPLLTYCFCVTTVRRKLTIWSTEPKIWSSVFSVKVKDISATMRKWWM